MWVCICVYVSVHCACECAFVCECAYVYECAWMCICVRVSVHRVSMWVHECACECASCLCMKCEHTPIIGGDQSKAWGILLYHCPPIPLRQGLSPILEVGWQPASPRNSPVSNLPHSEQAHLAMHMVAGDLNLGPHTHLASLSCLLSHPELSRSVLSDDLKSK